MAITLRAARPEDVEALHESCYPEADAEDVGFYLAWSLRQVQEGRMVRLVAEVDGCLVGNAHLTLRGSEGEIGSVVVSESHRRQGLARRLITVGSWKGRREITRRSSIVGNGCCVYRRCNDVQQCKCDVHLPGCNVLPGTKKDQVRFSRRWQKFCSSFCRFAEYHICVLL